MPVRSIFAQSPDAFRGDWGDGNERWGRWCEIGERKLQSRDEFRFTVELKDGS